jgi:exonuclease VII small subunit
MTPSAIIMLICGVFDAHPEWFLSLHAERQPGESEVQYIRREMARLDAVMQRMFAKGEVLNARADATLQRTERTLQMAAAARAKRQTDSDTLKALGGGIADHPKASLLAPPSPERLAAEAKLKSAAEIDRDVGKLDAELVELAKKDPKYQRILDQYREDIRKAREVGKSKPAK